MSKRIAKIGAAAAIVATTFLGVTVITSSPAAASMPAACNDFAKILDYYLNVGDQATADALFVNMVNMGCYPR
jgi:hypothetical protein